MTTEVGNLTALGYSITDSVAPGFGDSKDYYNFSLDSQANVQLNMTGISGGDADLYLYQYREEGPVPVGASSAGGESDELISVILEPGDYVASVVPFYGIVDYTLEIVPNFPSAPIADFSAGWGMSYTYNLGMLTPGADITTDALPENSLSLNGLDMFGETGGDWSDGYSFTINTPSTVTITQTPGDKNYLSLELYDSEDLWIDGSYLDEGNSITADLVPGTYWVGSHLGWSDRSDGTATYDLNISAVDLALPTAQVTPANGNGMTLVDAMLNNDGSIAVSAANYYGDARQAVGVENFAGEYNTGILLSTGNAINILAQTYNQKAGADTSNAEIVKNWANSGSTAYMQKGNLGSAGTSTTLNDPNNPGAVDVFTAIGALATAQGLEPVTRVYDTASLSFDFTSDNNAVTFDMIFASEEFPYFANKYVDGATIMVDGKNYALFDLLNPDTLLSVTQANVDAGYFSANTQYDADGNATTTANGDVVSSAYATEFNGISDLISILAPLDTTLETHNITISIADTNDHVLDSGLFMSNLHGLSIDTEDFGGLMRNISDSENTSADVAVGGDTGDYSEAGAGNDTTDGGAGRDYLFGDEGDDAVEGGEGDDYVDGGVGNDVLTGDIVLTGDAVDDGEGGDDTLSGGEGNDSVDGGSGDDALSGGVGNDTLDGGTGDDDLEGGDTGRDSLFGGEGDDVITSSTDKLADTVDGGEGDDMVTIEGSGNDSANGGVGDDELISDSSGRDSLFGGEGDDVITGGTDKAADQLAGGDGADTITGGISADKITGDAGDDIISGGSGNDQIALGTGSDTVDGGIGNDTINLGVNDQTSDTVIVDDSGKDVIQGFDADGMDQDFIDVVDPTDLDFFNVSGGVKVQISISISITIMGVTQTQILDNFI